MVKSDSNSPQASQHHLPISRRVTSQNRPFARSEVSCSKRARAARVEHRAFAPASAAPINFALYHSCRDPAPWQLEAGSNRDTQRSTRGRFKNARAMTIAALAIAMLLPRSSAGLVAAPRRTAGRGAPHSFSRRPGSHRSSRCARLRSLPDDDDAAYVYAGSESLNAVFQRALVQQRMGDARGALEERVGRAVFSSTA